MNTNRATVLALLAVLLAPALGGCDKSSSGPVRLDSPNTGAGNSATGATGGTATSPGTGSGTANDAAITPGRSTGATPGTASPNPDAAAGGGAGKPGEQSKPPDKGTTPPY
jgi:hypothetical protein